MTGAVLPEGADCVVPYEATTRSKVTHCVTLAPEAELRPGSADGVVQFLKAALRARRGDDVGAFARQVNSGLETDAP